MARIDGKTLIAWGYEPGPWFKTALKTLAVEPDCADPRAVVDRVRHDWRAAEAQRLDDARALARQALPAGVVHDPGATAPEPVGGVIAYRDHVSVSGVGFDIACGNMAVRTELRAAEPGDREAVADRLAGSLSFDIGRVNDEGVEHPLFDDGETWGAGDVEDLRQMAPEQLGTIGSGNHDVDLFADPDDWVWVGVHFGSRGFGHRTVTRYLKMAGGAAGTAWVVRKGATPVFPGQRALVGGSMGDDAVIVGGTGSAESNAIWHSTIHGAGLDESPMAYRRLDDVLAWHASSIRVVTRLRPLVIVMASVSEADPYKD